jgi:hypothetical protein
MTARLGIVGYWAAVAGAIYFFLTSALCAAIFFGLIQGDRTDAALTAIFCAVLGFAVLMCGHAIRALLTNR